MLAWNDGYFLCQTISHALLHVCHLDTTAIGCKAGMSLTADTRQFINVMSHDGLIVYFQRASRWVFSSTMNLKYFYFRSSVWRSRSVGNAAEGFVYVSVVIKISGITLRFGITQFPVSPSACTWMSTLRVCTTFNENEQWLRLLNEWERASSKIYWGEHRIDKHSVFMFTETTLDICIHMF